MGELENWPVHQNGGDLSEFNMPTSPFRRNSSPNPQFEEIRGESWHVAERATEGVVQTIQATVVSEKTRQEVVEFVQRLIRGTLGCEVFPFGSVPLKTYLPDGDIDLTAFSMPNSDDSLSTNVLHVLQTKEHNNDSEFELKDVQFINAEVKLVKCLVQNIVVDISFNQSGGLSTLCFLERVDRMIGKDHLFKRSIILIKSWCYYESRILGAHHALISTYALETLVLHIFHTFSASLDGPFTVLYKFLEYYSKFDWENFCVSIYGPILVSSLPGLVAEAPENDEVGSLFTKDFIKKCVEKFSVPPSGLDSNSKVFPQKHLNIVDPLKDYNNLGRSVSRGNFYRIRSAFTYGARKLGRILLLPSESIATEIKAFFANTLDGHRSGERPDVQDVLPAFQKNTSLYPVLDTTDGDRKATCEAESSLTSKSTSWFITHGPESKANGSSGSSKQNKLADLTGDYETHFHNLLYVQQRKENVLGTRFVYPPHSPSYQYHSNPTWARPQVHSGYFTHLNINGVVPGPSFFPSGNYAVPYTSGVYGVEDLPKPRGTGTYFPNMNYRVHKDRNSPRRGKISAPANNFSRHHYNGLAETPHDVDLQERGDHNPPPQLQFPVFSGSGHGMSSIINLSSSIRSSNFSRHNGLAEIPHDVDLQERRDHNSPPQLQLPIFSKNGHGMTSSVNIPSSIPFSSLKETSTANGSVLPSDAELQFGTTLALLPSGVLFSDGGRRLDSGLPASSVQNPSVTSNQESFSQAYQLRDEYDFPPLSG